MSKSYDLITQAIVKQLEEGTIPWRKPWNSTAPANLVSRKSYRGINVFMLACQGFASPYWLTYRQAAKLGGHVRKGEKSTPVVFWKWFNYEEKDEETGEEETKRRPMLKYYRVFNVSQCEIDESKIPTTETRDFQPIDRAEEVVDGMPQRPIIRHEHPQASYSPLADVVNMPVKELFHSDASYYTTIFHELAHATGHESRLARLDSTDPETFGGESYSKEELIAEMGAAYLNGHCEIEQETIENSAAYIKGWLSKLKKDNRLIVYAAAAAQKAADFILNRKFEEV